MIRRGGWDFPGFPGEDYPPPESITIAGREVRAGTRVRLCPKKRRADAFDAILDGKTGTVEVIQRLVSKRYPEGVQVTDFGIRGIELAYILLDDYDALVLVDAVPRGGP